MGLVSRVLRLDLLRGGESFTAGSGRRRGGVGARPAPWPIKRAWGYNVATSGTDAAGVAQAYDAATIAANHDVVVLTKNDGRAAVAAYRALGVEVIQYILATEVRDNSTNNNIAWDNLDGSTYDLDAAIDTDWYLYTGLSGGGFTRIQTSANRFMNPANTDYQQYFVDRVRDLWTTRGEDWDGIFLDNIFRSIQGGGSNGLRNKALATTNDDGSGKVYARDGGTFTEYTQDQTGNDAYRDGVVAFVEKVRTDLADHYGVPLWCNAVEPHSSYDSLPDLAPLFDGIMLERLWTDWPDGANGGGDGNQANDWVSAATWLDDMAQFQTIRDEGTRVWAQGRGPMGVGYTTDPDLLGFTVASFLLVYSSDDVFRYAHSAYSNFLHDPIFQTAGYPTGDYYETSPGSGTYRRNFATGHVEVNPTTHAYTINL